MGEAECEKGDRQTLGNLGSLPVLWRDKGFRGEGHVAALQGCQEEGAAAYLGYPWPWLSYL